MRPRKPKYRSRFEADVAALLPKKRCFYEPETLNYSLENLSYTPDWLVQINGEKFYLEAKGQFDYIQRRKMLAIIKCNPLSDIRLVFMRNNRISKASKTTYTDWCAAHGIRCSVYPKLPV